MKNEMTRDTLEWLGTANQKVQNKEELLSKVDDVLAWVTEELNEFRQAVEEDDVPGMYNAIGDAHWIVDNLTFQGGLDPDLLDEEGFLIRQSNFSKFCMTKEEAELSVKLYAEGKHPNKMGKVLEVYYKETNNEVYPYVLLQKKDNKILKSHLFKDVDELRPILEVVKKRYNKNEDR